MTSTRVHKKKERALTAPFFISNLQWDNQNMELVFEVTQEADGGFCAECLTADIFTQGDTWDELRGNVREAVQVFYFDNPAPTSVRLHLVRDEVLALK